MTAAACTDRACDDIDAQQHTQALCIGETGIGSPSVLARGLLDHAARCRKTQGTAAMFFLAELESCPGRATKHHLFGLSWFRKLDRGLEAEQERYCFLEGTIVWISHSSYGQLAHTIGEEECLRTTIAIHHAVICGCFSIRPRGGAVCFASTTKRRSETA